MITEQVLVVSKKIIHPNVISESEKLKLIKKEVIYDLILNNYSFIERAVAEKSFNMKQIIPYVVIQNNNKFLLLKRTEKQTEKRLHNKLSLGIGGHINPDELETYDNIIEGGLYRELYEEVLVKKQKSLSFIGVINDDSNEVSSVHLGLLYILKVESDEFVLPEKEKMTGHWAKKEDILMFYDNLETWSQIAYNYLIGT